MYTYPENFRAYKALIAAEFSGVKVTVAPNFEFGVTNKTEAFLKKFPSGQVRVRDRQKICLVGEMFAVRLHNTEQFEVSASDDVSTVSQ